MKYVRYYGDENFEELYDLVKDPHELHNVIADPVYQDQRRVLAAKTETGWIRTGGQNAEYYATQAFKEGLDKSEGMRRL